MGIKGAQFALNVIIMIISCKKMAPLDPNRVYSVIAITSAYTI